MMSDRDADYSRKRAEDEKRRADTAATPEAARAHRTLAELHRDRAGKPANG